MLSFENLDFHKFIESLVKTIELKDQYTAGHSMRVSELTELICRELGMYDFECNYLHIAAHLHDIGKIAIPDGILLKTSKLSKAEYMVMQEHSFIGASIFEDLPGFESMAKIIKHHHERFDGSGYPDGLSGTDIPYGAAIISVADSFDAMTTLRPYKETMHPDSALDEIIKSSGTQFHPDIVKVFSKVYHTKREAIFNILNNKNRNLFWSRSWSKEEIFLAKKLV